MSGEAERLKSIIQRAKQSGNNKVRLKALRMLKNFNDSQPEPEKSILQKGFGVASEAASAVNRGAANMVDFFTTDQINAISRLAGNDLKLQGFAKMLSSATQGGQMEEGLARDVVRAAGEVVAPGAAGGAAIRGAAKFLPAQAAGESAAIGAARSLSSGTTLGADAGLSAASGAGSEIGESVGGAPGALIGGIAAPVAIAGLKSLAVKSAGNIRILDSNGLPSKEIQRSLSKRGLDLGDIIDDVDQLPAVIRGKDTDEFVDGIVKNKLIRGSKNNALATVRLENNSIVRDDLGEELLRQGFKEGDISAAKMANSSTRSEMDKMLGMQRRILSNTSESQNFRPTDVVGEHVKDRFDFIRNKASDLSKQLDKIAKGSGSRFAEGSLPGPGVNRGLRGKEINIPRVEQNVIDQLGALNIDIPDNVINDTTLIKSFLKGKDSFVGSQISKDKTSQKVIRDVVDLMSEPGSDAFRAHNLKRQLDSMIDFQKKSAQGLTESGRKFAKSVRASLNDAIRDVSPEYARVNDDLSAAIQSMDGFQKVLGGSIDINAEGASKAIGQDLRGLLSNRKTRVKLENSVNEIDEVARALGADFDVDVKDLTQFANTLDTKFGAVARTSLKGEVTAIAESSMRGASGLSDFAGKKVVDGIEKMRGINDKAALNSMQKILKRGK